MPLLRKVYVGSFTLLLVPAWFFQRSLEASGNSDLLGSWYTVYCAVFWSFVAACGVTVLAALLHRICRVAAQR
jgi:hypothetical protein